MNCKVDIESCLILQIHFQTNSHDFTQTHFNGFVKGLFQKSGMNLHFQLHIVPQGKSGLVPSLGDCSTARHLSIKQLTLPCGSLITVGSISVKNTHIFVVLCQN